MNNKKRSLSNVNDPYVARIQSMPESTSAFVRSAQVISSYFRAIEEITRNSIMHGLCSNVTITINKTKNNRIHVNITDDGLGLEETAMRDLIGTRYCSSTGSLSAQCIASRGESLKAIADLCVEFRISSTHGICKTSDVSDQSRASSVSLLTAPSKKKRREYPSEHCTSQLGYSRAYSHLVTSEKIIQNGKVVSFKSKRHPVDEAKENRIGTGTVIQLFGLFHRCHVRQKHCLRNFAELSTTDNTISENSFSSTKIKHCIQMLAAAFPFVNFQFYPPSPSNQLPPVLATRERYEWLTSMGEERSFECKTLLHENWWSFVKFRFCQMIGDKFNKDAKILKINFYEDSNDDEANDDYSGRRLFSNDKQTQWKVQGILCINKAYLESETCPRSRQHELIFVNHRLLRNSVAVADIVQSICAQLYGIKRSNGTYEHIFIYFVIHS
jgi:DNA mismatch repair ATPase MutL